MQNKSKHFSHQVDHMMACPCCGKGTLSVATLMLLEDVRVHFGVPVTITSGARCVKYQKGLNPSAPNSKHIITKLDEESQAVDFVVQGVKTSTVRTFLSKQSYAGLIGVGKYNTFVHADTRGVKARW
jgi:uncharacterized protein YcbK (DUF882 family)